MPPSPALVRVDRSDLPGLEHVAEIVLDRPEAMNAVSTEMARAIAAATEQVARDDTVHCVVLTSSHDRAFCVGADLKERNAFTDADLMEQRPVARAAYGGVLALPMPAIAAVDGFALGGGLELALSCDIVIAGEGALVGLRNAKRAMRLGADVDLATGLEVEDACWRATAFSGDRREGVAAFAEKRRPQWPGR